MAKEKKVPCKKCYNETKDFSEQQMMSPTDPTSTVTDGYGCPECGNYMPNEQVAEWLKVVK